MSDAEGLPASVDHYLDRHHSEYPDESYWLLNQTAQDDSQENVCFSNETMIDSEEDKPNEVINNNKADSLIDDPQLPHQIKDYRSTSNMDPGISSQLRTPVKIHPECPLPNRNGGVVHHRKPAVRPTAWDVIDNGGVFSGYSDLRTTNQRTRPKITKALSVDERSGYGPRTRLSSSSQREHREHVSHKSNHSKDRRVSLQVFDISGDSYEARYPWQRDIAIQCDIYGKNPKPKPSPLVNENKPPVYHSHRQRSCSYSEQRSAKTGSKPAKTRQEVIYKAASTNNISEIGHSASVPATPISRQDHSGWFTTDTLEKCRRHAVSTPDVTSSGVKERLKRISLKLKAKDSYSNASAKTQQVVVRENDTDSVDELDNLLKSYQIGESERADSSDEVILSPPMSRSCRLKLVPMMAVDISSSGSDLASRSDTLNSPRVSPISWQHSVPDVIVTPSGRDIRSQGGNTATESGSYLTANNRLRVPHKVLRRTSSGSIQSQSDESDSEPSPPVLRRGRRQAIFDSKSLGLVSPTNIDDVSPSNSCDELDSAGGIPPERLGRKRSSVELGMHYPGDLLVQEHHKKVLIKRNTIADFAATRSHYGSTASLYAEQDTKKLKGTFSLLKLIDKKTRSKDIVSNLDDILRKLKRSEFKDSHLMSYKDVHWSELIASTDKDADASSITEKIPEIERKRREAVWELFKSECVFLIDHLMVLKHCFMEPMKKVQVEGQLMFAEPQDVFGNLDEICYVSYTFCRDFISLLLKDVSATEFGRTEVLLKALQRFSQHSRDGEVYHNYCLNYSKAVSYLDHLRRNEDYCEFEKWCEQDPRCNRLQLMDLLISPMQHCTKMPLLLSNIRRYTEEADERMQLTESLDKLETSLKNLEAKMKWLKNYERVQEIQQQIIWQPISEIEPRAFIPEFLKGTLQRQPCERLLASPKRQLLHEGQLMLIEMSKSLDMYLFLFDDILLLTKIKKPPRKKSSEVGMSNQRSTTEGAVFVVHRQPIALDRFTIHEVKPYDAQANGIKHAFVLVQISRFQQIIGVYTLQAPNETIKFIWLNHLESAQKRYREACENKIRHQSPGNSPTNITPNNCKYPAASTKNGKDDQSTNSTSKTQPVIFEDVPEDREPTQSPVTSPTRTVSFNHDSPLANPQEQRQYSKSRQRAGILKVCHERSQTIDAVYL